MSTAKRRMRRITMDPLQAAGTRGRSPEAATTPITTGEQWTEQDSERSDNWETLDTSWRHLEWLALAEAQALLAEYCSLPLTQFAPPGFMLSETNIKIAWPRRNYLSNNFIVPGMITTNNTSLRKSKTDTEERKQLETHHSWLVFVAFLRADM